MTSRRQFLLAAAAASGCQRSTAISRAVDYLLSRQQGDGGWHSRTYGLLASGQSLTPFVLKAMLRVSPGLFNASAFEFIARHTDADGALGRSDPIAIDYPNYATALAVRAYSLGRPSGWQERAAAMVEYLRSQQLVDALGWQADDAAYGAWGVGGDPQQAPHPGHVDLSMTRHVIEGLQAAGVKPDDPALVKARVFVERCQNPDGGFHFSTVVLDANKAGQEAGRYRSYSTATADGLRCLKALGYPAGHQRLEAAYRWLAAHWEPDRATGFVGETRWPRGLRYYNAEASSPLLTRSKLEAQRTALLAEQESDGSWSNPENLVKEDDPLIATGFALSALAACERAKRPRPEAKTPTPITRSFPEASGERDS